MLDIYSDIIHAVGIDVKHTPGEFLVADILTTILKGDRLKELSSQLGLRSMQSSKNKGGNGGDGRGGGYGNGGG